MRTLDSIKILSLLCFISIDINSEFTTNTLTINSSSIEVKKNYDEIIFNGNVLIKSKDFIINADNAIYNNIKKIVSVNGAPSRINSTYEDNIFIGSQVKTSMEKTMTASIISINQSFILCAHYVTNTINGVQN